MDTLALARNWADRTGKKGLSRAISSRISMARNRFSSYGMPSRFSKVLRLSNRVRQKAARSFTMNKRRRSPTTAIGVTEQYDARTIYRRKRMSRGKRKAWKKFSRKVLAVSEKGLGTQQCLFNTPVTFSETGAGNQLIAAVSLYGLRSTNTLFNDLRSLSNSIALAATTVNSGLAVGESSNIIFKSGILDITIRNASTNNGAPDSAARLELDIYELQVSRTAEESGATYNTIQEIFSQNDANTLTIGGAGTEITQFLRGATPFDLSYSLSRFGIRINRKTKYTIANGDQITYQMRDPRRYVLPFREMSNKDGFNRPGMTRVIYMVAKLCPGLTVGPIGAPGVYQQIVNVGATRKYTFKVENWSEDRTIYL